MNYKLIALLALFCSTATTYCNEDKIIEAIEDSNPEMLQSLLIPGFLIRLEDKKRYVSLAQEVTNRTHAQLHKYSGSDVIRVGKGGTYLGLSTAFGIASALMFTPGVLPDGIQRYWGAGWNKLRLYCFEPVQNEEGHVRETGQPLVKDHYFAAGLAALSGYFAIKGLVNIKDILTSKARHKRHKNALAVEAIIQRLPAFDNGCFVPGSLS